MEKIAQAEELVDSMTVLELSQFVKRLEEKWGVSAAAPAVAIAAGAGPGAGEAAAEEEQTEFDVVLTAIGDKKIQVIKTVRELTGLGLKEAKAVVDATPGPVKEKVSKEESEAMKDKLQEAGASVEIK